MPERFVSYLARELRLVSRPLVRRMSAGKTSDESVNCEKTWLLTALLSDTLLTYDRGGKQERVINVRG